MTFKIYTKKGDDGTTGLIGGVRVPKHHLRVESYGTVDELNSHLGLIRASGGHEEVKLLLPQIQDRLFTIGSLLASAPGSKMAVPDLYESDIESLEQEIDRLTKPLPELRNFILPGGSVAGSEAHVARCVCRRAERLVVQLSEEEEVEALVVAYLNRLSDYLFTLARALDLSEGKEEIPWVPRQR